MSATRACGVSGPVLAAPAHTCTLPRWPAAHILKPASVGRDVREAIMPATVHVVGLGGSLRTGSTSRTALQTALEGVSAAGAQPSLISIRDLDLPLYSPEHGDRKSVV